MMKTHIALFRGINVGGNTILPMKDLIALLAGLGCEAIKTYIQSGNVLFRNKEKNTTKLANAIGAAVKEKHAIEPRVMLLEPDDLKNTIAANPFPDAESEPKSLHVFFLDSPPKKPDLATLETIKKENEEFQLKDRVYYLHAPDGIGRSKLAAKVEKALGVACTARNWRTICKIVEMVKEYK